MKDIPTSPRIIAMKRRRRIIKIWLGILFVVLFVLFVWLFSFLSGYKKVTIENIAITGTHIVDQDGIESTIHEDLSGKYLYLFDRNNSFIYPHNKIYKDLTSNFPRIKSLNIYLDSLNTLHIDIIERTGEYLYCGSSIPTVKNDIGENCYFINNDGLIFDKAPYFSGNVYFKYYLPLDKDYADPLGKQMLEIDKFHKLARFIDSITAIGFKPIYIYKDKDGTDSLYLNHGEKDTAPKITFKDDADLATIQDNLSIAMNKPEFADEINSKYTKLLYIDLRFKDKVLYKFQ